MNLAKTPIADSLAKVEVPGEKHVELKLGDS